MIVTITNNRVENIYIIVNDPKTITRLVDALYPDKTNREDLKGYLALVHHIWKVESDGPQETRT